ncbi:MAG TPA: LacI family DNA-binding transcriptional regulator [Roseiarcus sp.]
MTSRKRYASSIDVAKLAGVSQSAVSRTYRQGTSVSEETRRKVLEAATALDYRPSMIPRIMLTHRSYLVAVVVGGLYNPFYATVLEIFSARLQDAGYQVLLMHTDSGHTLDDIIPRLSSYRVDAIVSALAVMSGAAAQDLARLKIPVVLFNAALANKWVSSVSSDNLGAGRAVAAHLVERGAKRFGFIAGPANSSASKVRFAGFRGQLAENQTAPVAFAEGDYRYEGGRAAALAIFAAAHPPDALFCANDLMAIGAMDALRTDLGLRVPEDVLVAGFDDIPAAAWAAYGLTTVVQDASRMVDQTIALLRARMAQHDAPGGVRTIVPATLVVRGSTRR